MVIILFIKNIIRQWWQWIKYLDTYQANRANRKERLFCIAEVQDPWRRREAKCGPPTSVFPWNIYTESVRWTGMQENERQLDNKRNYYCKQKTNFLALNREVFHTSIYSFNLSCSEGQEVTEMNTSLRYKQCSFSWR